MHLQPVHCCLRFFRVGFNVADGSSVILTETSLLMLTLLLDSIGRIATILFAHLYGIALEADCKKYRFLADIFNDLGIFLDFCSPIFPGPIRVALLCLSGSLKALCGVAGGATKASLSVHFAKSGNVGELNAKVRRPIPAEEGGCGADEGAGFEPGNCDKFAWNAREFFFRRFLQGDI